MDNKFPAGNGGGRDGNFADLDSDKYISEPYLRKGQVLKNRYEVISLLGHGGFGLTYVCYDRTLDLKVAVKEYYPDGFATRNSVISAKVTYSATPENMEFIEKGRKRFIDEARVLAKFSGETGIVDVRDYFEENNTAYIVMEFLEGEDLGTFLKKKGRLPAAYAVRMLLPVMESLEKIHRQGLIHRDISPDNIRMVGNGLKLIDFGAARDFSFEGTKTMTVMLKRGYAPIEQYGAVESQGPWTDVYALCATLYLCITGRKPADALVRWENDPLQKPSQLGIAINPVLEGVIMKGLSVSVKDRYQSMSALVYSLNLALTGNSVPVAPRKTNGDPSKTQRVNNGNINQGNANINYGNANSSLASNDEAEKVKSEKPKNKSKILIPVIAVTLVIAILAGVLVLRHFGYFTPAYGGDTGIVVDDTSANDAMDSDESESTIPFAEQLVSDENTSVSDDDKANLVNILERMLWASRDTSDGTIQEYDCESNSSWYDAMSLMVSYPYEYATLHELASVYGWNCDPMAPSYNEDTQTETLDPQNAFLWGYCYIDACYADIILEYIFNVQPDGNNELYANGEMIAYYGSYAGDDNEYLFFGKDEYHDQTYGKVEITEERKLDDGRYRFSAVYCDTDGVGEWNHKNIEITAELKYVDVKGYVEGQNVWSIYKIEIV